MKVAIQIFGHLRSYKKCYKALHKHLISKYDCDVFMHTWSLTNHSTKTWHKNICKAKPVYGKEDYLKKIYNLKSLKIEEQKQEDLGKFISFKKEISILGIKALFHTMKSVNDLRLNYEKQNKVKYDFVIMVRPDILLKTDFQIDDFIKEVDKELINKSVFTIGFPIFNTLNYFQTIGATDVLFFTKPEILNNIYKNEDKFLSIVFASPILPFLNLSIRFDILWDDFISFMFSNHLIKVSVCKILYIIVSYLLFRSV